MLKIAINHFTTFRKQISPCTQAKLQYCNTTGILCVHVQICVRVCECMHSHLHFTILLDEDRYVYVNTYMHQIVTSFLHYLWVYNATGLEKQIQHIQFCPYKKNTIWKYNEFWSYILRKTSYTSIQSTQISKQRGYFLFPHQCWWILKSSGYHLLVHTFNTAEDSSLQVKAFFTCVKKRSTKFKF
jgi:hypothetical protein